MSLFRWRKNDSKAQVPESRRSSMTKKETKDEQTMKRNQAFQEIVDTEKSYISSLEAIIDIYMKPLADNEYIDDDQHTIIFSNLETLLTLNQRFLGDLLVHAKYDPSRQMIGGLFLEFSPFFKMYSHYVKCHENGSRLLSQLLSSNRKFADFCDNAAKQPRCRNLPLGAMLIMPIQRIPRYKLLLDQLLKLTPTKYEDYGDLTVACDLLNSVAHHINEEAKAQDNRNKIRDIETLFSESPGFLAPGRYIMKYGELQKRARAGGSSTTYTFFLFNSCLAFASKKLLGSLKLVASIPIDSAFSVATITPEVAKTVDTKNLEVDKAFVVNSTLEAFVLLAPTPQEAAEWVSVMKESIEWQKELDTFDIKNSDEATQKGLWVSDEVVSKCMVCEADFTVFRWKHHCRQCGSVVCDGCCTKREITTKTGGKKQKRVCGNCDLLLATLSGEEGTAEGESRGKKHASSVAVDKEPVAAIKTWERAEGSTVTYYLITVHSPNQKPGPPIKKRYKEFEAFDKALRKKHTNIKTVLGDANEQEVAGAAEGQGGTLGDGVEALQGTSSSSSSSSKSLVVFYVPALPAKKISNSDPQLLEERRVAFQNYLRTIFRLFKRMPELRKETAAWLGVHESTLSSKRDESGCSIM